MRYYSKSGIHLGLLSTEGLSGKANGGQMPPSDLVPKKSMSDWKPLAQDLFRYDRTAALECNEAAVDLAYRYSITDSLNTVASARIARYSYDQFGRDESAFGSGIELIWQISPSFKAAASLFFDKNDSDSFGIFNEYEAWTSGVGVGLRWLS